MTVFADLLRNSDVLYAIVAVLDNFLLIVGFALNCGARRSFTHCARCSVSA